MDCKKLIDDLECNEFVPIPTSLNRRMYSKELLLFVQIGMFLFCCFISNLMREIWVMSGTKTAPKFVPVHEMNGILSYFLYCLLPMRL